MLSEVEFGIGSRVYVSYQISHFKENNGESRSHRLVTVKKINNLNGRVYLDIDSGDRIWKKKKNLRLVLIE